MSRNTATNPSTPRAAPAPPALSTRAFLLLLGAILLLGLALQLAMISEFLRKHPAAFFPWGDGVLYWDWAAQIAHGHLLTHQPFNSAPLYPYVLGLLRFLGLKMAGVFGVQLALHLLTAGLIGWVARRRFGPATGLGAAAIYLALSDPSVSVVRILANILQMLVVTLLWWRWAVLADTSPRRWRDVALTGALVGLLALAYPSAMLLLPVLGLWLAWDGRWRLPAWRRGVVGAACAAVVILPATLANYAACGEFIPIAAHSGHTLAQGNQPESIGVFTDMPGLSHTRGQLPTSALVLYEKATGHQGTWNQAEAYLRRGVYDYWFHHPAATLRLFARKVYLFFTARDYDDTSSIVMDYRLGLARLSILAPLPVPWIMGPALAALVLLRRDFRRLAPEWVLPGLVLLTITIFFYTPRYRVPALPPLCALAAYALVQLRRPGLGRWLIVGLTLLFPVLTAVNRATGLDDAARIEGYPWALAAAQVEVGDALLAKGDLVGAGARYRSAIAIEPMLPSGHTNLGMLLARQEHFDEAWPEMQRGVAVGPHDPEAWRGLYNLCAVRRDYAGALHCLRQIVASAPNWGQARLALAWIEATSTDAAVRNGTAAVSLAQDLCRRRGDWLEARAALAAGYAELGRFDEAIQAANQAIAAGHATGNRAGVAQVQQHLELYRAHKPVRALPILLR